MKLIKDGRLFGKLNLVDLVVILLVLAVGASLILKREKASIFLPITEAEQEKIEYDVICRMVSKVMLPDFEKSIGGQLMSNGELVDSCFLKDMKVEPFYESYVDGNGELQRAESPDFCNVIFTIGGTALYQDNSYHVGSQEVRTGKSHIVKTRTIEITGNVIRLEGRDG